jgi:transglutaminase-like putative cysteine protease
MVCCGVLIVGNWLISSSAWADAPAQTPAPKTRSFLFTYSATLAGLQAGQMARVWFPVPPSNEDQQVQVESKEFPADVSFANEPQYGNRIGYFQSPPGADRTIRFNIVYRVTRREVGESPPAEADEPGDRKYLRADQLVPIGGKPMTLLANRQLPDDSLALGRLLYDVVDEHMEYRKDKPGWGRGDATWACESGFGNCTDFHSLFISLARSEHMPAIFEIGFSIPPQRGVGEIAGYHCWAKFKPAGHGWVPVDASEGDKNPDKRDYFFGHLCENRVTFSTGRDLILVPKQDGPPVNFFIYPHVEVSGSSYSPENVKRTLTYQDLPIDGH